MEGERRASPERSSGLPAGGAAGEIPGDRSPLPGSSGCAALLQADVLDLDEEDDLEVFSKVRAAAARPGKFPVNSRSLQRCGRRPGVLTLQGAGSEWEVGGVPRLPARAPQRAAPSAACGQGPDSQPLSPLHFDLKWGRAVTSWSLQSCDLFFFLFFLLFFSDADFWEQCLSPGGGGPKVPPPLTFL